MAKPTFGVPSLKKPTPKKWSNGIDIISAVAGVLIAWLTTATYIPNDVSNIISSILGLIIGISQAVKPFIGINVSEPTVPIDEVEVIDRP
jgi:hypothetical protein